MNSQDKTILIFKTSVKYKKDIVKIKNTFKFFKTLMLSFDLEDCDKIMRTEGTSYTADEIISRMQILGYQCEELE